MKAKIIAVMSILSIIGLAFFAYGAQTINKTSLMVLTVSLSLVPMYFLYSVFILGRYKDAKKTGSDKKSGRKQSDKKTKDYGKVIEFPKDKKDNKQNNGKK